METTGKPSQITFHMGLPRTGTSSLQHVLARSAAQLAEQDLYYPEAWRGESQVAHHQIAAQLSGEEDAISLAARVVEEAGRSGCSRVLISTESLDQPAGQ